MLGGTLAQGSVVVSRVNAATLAPMLSSVTMLISPPSRARQIIANHLWTYGEDRLAGRPVELTDQEIERLQDIAGYYSGTPDTPSGAGMLFA